MGHVCHPYFEYKVWMWVREREESAGQQMKIEKGMGMERGAEGTEGEEKEEKDRTGKMSGLNVRKVALHDREERAREDNGMKWRGGK